MFAKLGRCAASTLSMLALIGTALTSLPSAAKAQFYQPYIGEIRVFATNWCPRDWAQAAGQMIAINDNQALFSLLGTIYGGDGRTTFALPDLRSRVPIGSGQAPGLSNIPLGARGGSAGLTMSVAQMPSHSHTLRAVDSPSNSQVPTDAFFSEGVRNGTPEVEAFSSGPANARMNTAMIAQTGSSQPIPVDDPYLGMTWCVALFGTYPSRN